MIKQNDIVKTREKRFSCPLPRPIILDFFFSCLLLSLPPTLTQGPRYEKMGRHEMK